MNKKFTSSITGASILLVFFAIFSKGLGFIREMFFANFFGLSQQFDIYLIGAVLPLTINTIILYLGQNYLIPSYNKIKKIDPSETENFIKMNFFIFFIGGIIIAVILYIFSKPLISLYLHDSSSFVIELASNIFSLFLISIPFTCVSSVLTAYQQIHFEFKHPAFSRILASISLLIVLVLFGHKFGIYIIPIGYILGSFLQMVYLLKKSKIKLNFYYKNISLNKIKKFIPTTLFIIILIESISQLYLIVDRYFYNYVPTGGIAALNYAQTIFILPISILSIALSTAIFPSFSELIGSNLFKELEKQFNESLKVNIALFIPISILFIFFGDFLITILYERGKFTNSDTMVTYYALIYYSISLVFYAAYSINNKLLYSLGLVKKLLYLTIIGIVVKIVLNFLLVKNLHQNGLALSSSISYFFFFIFSLAIIFKHVKFKNRTLFIKELLLILSNGALSLLLTYQISNFLPENQKILILKILLFMTFYSLNLYYIKHSSYLIIKRVVTTIVFSKQFNRY